MGILDLTSKVLTEFKADVGDMKAKIKELSGLERERAQQQLKDLEATNKAHEGYIGKLAKVGLALDAVGKFTDFARESLRTYGEKLRLEAAAGSANIDRLSDAFGGLVTKHDVLTFAAQTQHGVLKLNQQQQETLAKATVALTRAGYDQQEVFNKLKDAAIGLKVNGLDDLGISVQKGATDADTMSNMMAALNKVIAENGNLASSAADDVQRLGVMWDNAKDAIMSYAGATLSLSAAKEGRGFVFDATNIITLGSAARGLENRKIREANASQAALGVPTAASSVDEYGNLVKPFNITEAIGIDRQEQKFESFAKAIGQDYYMMGTIGGETSDRLRHKLDELADAQDKVNAKVARWREELRALANSEAKKLTDDLVTRLEAEQIAKAKPYSGPYSERVWAKTAEQFGAMNRQIAEGTIDQRYARFQQAKQAELFRNLGLPAPDDWDIAKGAVTGFTTALGPALDLVAQGQLSLAGAAKKTAGAVIHSLGDILAQKAAAEAVEGAAMLVTLNPAGGLHLAAAGILGAGAVAAYAAASRLGAGGGSAPSTPSAGGAGAGAGSSPSFGAGRASSGAAGERTIVVIGDSFSRSSPRMAQLEAERVVDLAYGGSGVTHR